MSNWEIGVYSKNGIPSLSSRNFEVSFYMEYDQHEQRYYYFDANCFDYIKPSDSAKDVVPIIEGIALIANGAIVLKTKNLQKILEIDWSYIFYDQQRVSFSNIDFQPSMNPFSIITAPQTQTAPKTINTISGIINLARKHDEIREILFMVGTFVDIPSLNKNISTWTTLYAITDTIFYYMVEKYKAKDYKSVNGKKKAKDKVLEMLSINETEYDRFSRTANNFDYLGINSRHGRQNFEPPKNPMSLMDAINFVFNMVDRFFYYGEINNHQSC